MPLVSQEAAVITNGVNLQRGALQYCAKLGATGHTIQMRLFGFNEIRQGGGVWGCEPPPLTLQRTSATACNPEENDLKDPLLQAVERTIAANKDVSAKHCTWNIALPSTQATPDPSRQHSRRRDSRCAEKLKACAPASVASTKRPCSSNLMTNHSIFQTQQRCRHGPP